MNLALHLVVIVAFLSCFVMVVIKMFRHGQVGLGILCSLLVWCIGGPIAFVFGWMHASELGIYDVMLVWTVVILVGFVLNLAMPLDLSQIPGFQE